MRDVANCVHNITGRIAIMDRKRKLEMAGRLQLRWQRWEMSNYDYLMQASCQTYGLRTRCRLKVLYCLCFYFKKGKKYN